MGLWTAALVRNHSLIDEFYKWTRVEEKDGPIKITNAEEFLFYGIYS